MRNLLVLIILFLGPGLRAQDSSLAFGAITSVSDCWVSALSLYPPAIKEINGDYINYRDTAGYGISMITESKCNPADVGNITIKGDTIKAIRYALFYYRKIQEDHEDYDHQLWGVINRLQAENKKAWAEAERIRKAGIKLAQNLTSMYNRDSRNPTKPK